MLLEGPIAPLREAQPTGNEIGQVRSLSADDGARARNCTQLFPQGQAAKV